MSDKNFVQRSDEELQKFVVGGLKPHDSQLRLSNTIRIGQIYMNGKLSGFVQFSATKLCKLNMLARLRCRDSVQNQ